MFLYPSFTPVTSGEGVTDAQGAHGEVDTDYTSVVERQILDAMSRDWIEIDAKQETAASKAPSGITSTSGSSCHQGWVGNMTCSTLEDSAPQQNLVARESGSDYTTSAATPSTIYYPMSPTHLYPQPVMSPAKSGHWFPQTSYSILAFKFTYPNYITTLDIWINIVRDQDEYPRYFTVYFDGQVVYRTTISSGFSGYVSVWWVAAGEHRIELEIYNCGWKEHQWKLLYIQPFVSRWPYPPEPIQDFWEYFPHGAYPILDYEVLGGPVSQLYLCVQNEVGSATLIEIYTKLSPLDAWTYRTTVLTGASYSIGFGDYNLAQSVYVRLKLMDSATPYYGKKLTYNAFNYRACMLEIDYMWESPPAQNTPIMALSDIAATADYVKWYYRLHGYGRYDYYIDEGVPYDSPTSFDDLVTYWIQYSDHKGDSNYLWVLIADRSLEIPNALGLYFQLSTGDSGIAIFDGLITSAAGESTGQIFRRWTKVTLLHECGHRAGIIVTDAQGTELYCVNRSCCMSDASNSNAIDAPWYCVYHWSLRKSPFL